ncbi:DUF1127 domain-containing protein [Pseudomonas sp. R-28-1W-6]|jgi:uncharacterized protein YjiS (DUF1127 family)|uniref:DUF1127 domain-containing protein n=1 Tax=Pseudomonas sp. R-28-1W-6 TaxID=2650101 RepID=UPI001365712D|nr:DUF1127 domain-containing protein [Pseudomonas sp. R-28-1W-6]MWV10750.1 DUF1127 domain-containing protein [Pseudomonas sp. R-28-1W-6]
MERTLSSDSLFQDSSSNARGSLPLQVIATLLLWKRRIISRHQLARLDERLLADAGISLYERQLEVSKPFWR